MTAWCTRLGTVGSATAAGLWGGFRNRSISRRNSLSVRLHFIGGAHSTKNDNGPAVFDHACQSGIEGIVSKRLDPNAVWTVKGLAQKSERSRAP
jgi:hypothetical protein